VADVGGHRGILTISDFGAASRGSWLCDPGDREGSGGSGGAWDGSGRRWPREDCSRYGRARRPGRGAGAVPILSSWNTWVLALIPRSSLSARPWNYPSGHRPL